MLVNPLAGFEESWTVMPEDTGSNVNRGIKMSQFHLVPTLGPGSSMAGERDCLQYTTPQVWHSGRVGTTLKKEGDNVVVLVIWHSD